MISSSVPHLPTNRSNELNTKPGTLLFVPIGGFVESRLGRGMEPKTLSGRADAARPDRGRRPPTAASLVRSQCRRSAVGSRLPIQRPDREIDVLPEAFAKPRTPLLVEREGVQSVGASFIRKDDADHERSRDISARTTSQGVPTGPSRSSRSRRRSSSAVCSGVNASSSSRRLLQRSSIRSTFSSAVNVERSSAGFAMPLSLARHPTFAKGRADRKRHGGQSSADENAPRLAPANEPNANSGSPATWHTGALKAAAVAHSARRFSSRPHRARPW
jgi:hypothetical protein